MTNRKRVEIEITAIKEMIYLIRGYKVILDSDIAKLNGIDTKVLNQAVRRNINRFPDYFMFQLTQAE
ncbi:MAG: ORF6N domain-containing protein [Bacteriovoracaceae bacterium]|nr:ORF6N domain-containing protein [Bacteriovoracaceae bacterium]